MTLLTEATLRPMQQGLRHTTKLAGAAYTPAVALMTWLGLQTLSAFLIGRGEDAWIFYWKNRWLLPAAGTALRFDGVLFKRPWLS